VKYEHLSFAYPHCTRPLDRAISFADYSSCSHLALNENTLLSILSFAGEHLMPGTPACLLLLASRLIAKYRFRDRTILKILAKNLIVRSNVISDRDYAPISEQKLSVNRNIDRRDSRSTERKHCCSFDL